MNNSTIINSKFNNNFNKSYSDIRTYVSNIIHSKNNELILILGPMFSGKTTSIINIYNEFKNNNHNHTIYFHCINYWKDIRYSTTQIVSHDGNSINSEFVENLNDYFEQNKNIFEEESYLIKNTPEYFKGVILINEIQFFNDSYDFIIKCINMGYTVICAGLNGDFKSNVFENISSLIPISNKIFNLFAKCKYCEDNGIYKPAIMSHKIKNDNNIIDIGGSDKYIPLCLSCYTIYK